MKKRLLSQWDIASDRGKLKKSMSTGYPSGPVPTSPCEHNNNRQVPKSPTVLQGQQRFGMPPPPTPPMMALSSVHHAHNNQILLASQPSNLTFPPASYSAVSSGQNLFQFADNPYGIRQSYAKDDISKEGLQISTQSIPGDPNQSPGAIPTGHGQFHKPFVSNNFLQLADNKTNLHVADIGLNLADDKSLDSLAMVPVSFQDGGQPSPASSTQSISTRGLRYQPAGGGDAMLSAINYNENEMLQEGGFDVTMAMDDTLLNAVGNSGNIRMSDTASGPAFDLFDGDGDIIEAPTDYQLSPQSFSETAPPFNIGDNNNLCTLPVPEQENQGAHEESQPPEAQQLATNSATTPAEKPRGKGRPAKGGSPGRPAVQCPICSKAFNNSSALAKHKLTHSDERKYVCAVCSKAFKRQDHLNGHMMTHRSKKPFECKFEGCDKSYCDARSLRRHHENHHQVNPETTTASTQYQGDNRSFTEGSGHIQYAPPPFSQSSQTSTQGQYFQFDPQYQQQFQNSNGDSSNQSWSQDPVNMYNAQRSPGYLQQVSPISPAPGVGNQPHPTSPMAGHPPQRPVWNQMGYNPLEEPKPVQCTICSRRFKNIPALNGHMRLHGGYFKKDNSKEEEKETQQHSPPIKKEVIAAHNGQSRNLAALKQHFQGPVVTVNQNLDHTTPLNSSSNVSSVEEQKLVNQTASKDPNLSPGLHSSNPGQETLPQTLAVNTSLSQPSEVNQTPQENKLSRCNPTTAFPGSQNNQMQLQQQQQMQQQQEIDQHLKQQQQQQQLLQQQIAAKIQQQQLQLQQHLQLQQLQQFQQQQVQYHQQRQQLQQQQQHQLQLTQQQHMTQVQDLHTIQQLNQEQQRQSQLEQQQQQQQQQIKLQQDQQLQHQEQKHFQDQRQQSQVQQQQLQQQQTQAAQTYHDLHDFFSLANQLNKDQRQLIVTGTGTDNLSIKSDTQQKSVTMRLPNMAADYDPHLNLTQTSGQLQPTVQLTDTTTRTSFTEQNTSYSNDSQFSQRQSVSSGTQSGTPSGTPTDSGPNIDQLPSPCQREFESKKPHDTQETAFKFPSRAPAFTTTQFLAPLLKPLIQDDNSKAILSERKRRASADPDKFTSPKRLLTDSNLSLLLSNASNDVWNRITGKSTGEEVERILKNKVEGSTFVKPSDDIKYRPHSRGDEPLKKTDDGLFRNPSSLQSSPVRAKKKHRPEPLIIPPHVNNCGFQSRLRSPRLWDGGTENHRGNTPPPYTPPPMLSPIRSGSGLFWTITGGYRPVTPKSAPVTPRLLNRRSSLGAGCYKLDSSAGITASTPVAVVEEVKEEPEEDQEPPPETDIQPHVNVGTQYQAFVPEFKGIQRYGDRVPCFEEKVWDSNLINGLTDEEVQNYLDFACSASVIGNGVNKEYALHLLHFANGDIMAAIQLLMNPEAKLPRLRENLHDYKYQESDKWTSEEIDAYHQGLMKFDKDFFNVSKEVGTKSVKQCVQFYYLWKKVCSDEYKRMRIIRRKREQDELYNLRSKVQQEQVEAAKETKQEVAPKTNSTVTEKNGKATELEKNLSVIYTCDYPACSASFNSKQALNGHVRIHGGVGIAKEDQIFQAVQIRSNGISECKSYPSSGPPSNKSVLSEPEEEFPCKICGKVFHKVKSRSAHMKSHRQQEPNHNKHSFKNYALTTISNNG